MKSFRRAGTARGLQANDAVDFFFLLDEAGHRIISISSVAFVVENLGQLEFRKTVQRIGHAGHALIKIVLAADSNDRDVAFAVKNCGHPFEALSAGFLVVGSDVENALRIRDVGIHADNGNALKHGLVNVRLETVGTSGGYADPSGVR